MFNLQCCQFQTCNILNLLNIYIYVHIHFLRFFSHIVHQSIEQKYSVLYCRSLLCVHVCVCACTCSQSLSCLQLFVTSWTIAHQAPLSMGFSRKEHWRGCHFLLQGIFPTRDQNHVSCISFTGRWILYHCAMLLVIYFIYSRSVQFSCSVMSNSL